MLRKKCYLCPDYSQRGQHALVSGQKDAMHTTINIRGRLIDLSRPLVMGILNVTPDSFFSASRVESEEAVTRRASEILSQGGTIIDVGACSTRPGGDIASEDEELSRLEMALRRIKADFPETIVSVDTFRPQVARRTVEEWGADMVNDVTEGTFDDGSGETMFECISRMRVPYVLTSVEATVEAMLQRFGRETAELHAMGAKDIILDPGFGFGKTLEENYAVIAGIDTLRVLGLPLLVGISRKSMLYRLLDTTPDNSLNATTVANTIALTKGTSILRVHDVKEAAEAVRIYNEMNKNN